MKGKRGLIMGVANDHSIAWGIAKALAAQGAELAFTYQGEALGKRVKPLAQSLGVELILPCDVEDRGSVDQVFEALRAKWGQLDFLVHAIAFSDKNELKGRYADTTRENFSRTMLISCFSFTELAKRAAELMPASGGAMVTALVAPNPWRRSSSSVWLPEPSARPPSGGVVRNSCQRPCVAYTVLRHTRSLPRYSLLKRLAVKSV